MATVGSKAGGDMETTGDRGEQLMELGKIRVVFSCFAYIFYFLGRIRCWQLGRWKLHVDLTNPAEINSTFAVFLIFLATSYRFGRC